MDPLVDWLYRRARFPRGLSVTLVYLIFISVVTIVIYFIIPPMVEQVRELGGRLEGIRDEISAGQSTFSRVFNQLGVPQGLSDLSRYFTELSSNFFQTTLGVFSGLIQAVAILAISFYLISSESGMKNFIKSLAPLKHKPYVVSLTEKIQSKIGRWLLGQLIVSTFIFIITFVGLTLLGVKFALALALLAGLLEIVPYLGPLLSAIPAVFVAFVQEPELALFVIVLYVLIQQVENYALLPKVMGKTVGANPLVILLAVLIGFQIAGILGMLLAVPIVAAISVVVSDVRASSGEL
jgi:predicted PurR-regulated permease PerM